jgi:putative endonuclease
MFTVYVLYSIDFDKIYIGYTANINDRMKSHNEIATKGWTISFRPWIILFTEQYLSKSQAIIREKQLKSAQGRAFIWKIIKNKNQN